MSKGVFVRRECVDAAGGPIGGWLLSQLLYLQDMRGEGFKTTKGQLVATGLTESNVRTWLPRLAAMKLIQYHTVGGRGQGGLYITVMEGCESAPLKVRNCTLKGVKSTGYTSYLEKRKKKDVDVTKETGKGRGKVIQDNKRSTTVEAALGKVMVKPPAKGLHGEGGKVDRLRVIWVTLHQEVWGEDHFISSWGYREKGMASHLIGKVPEVDMVTSFSLAVRNWSQFVAYVERVSSAFNGPSMPEIGYLVKHSGHMVNYAREGEGVAEEKLFVQPPPTYKKKKA